MSGIEHVRHSDTLRIGTIAYHLDSPAGDQDGVVSAICRPFDAPLSFTLDATDLGIPAPGVHLQFNGTPQDDLIVWGIDQPLDIPVDPIRLTRIHGQITTSVSEVTPTLGMACDGQPRAFFAALATTGNNNALTVETNVSFITAEANDIRIDATVGETLPPVFFRIVVSASHWLEDGCGMRFQAPNTDVVLTALAQDLIVSGTLQQVTFHWDLLDGPAHITSAPDQQSATVHMEGVGIVRMRVTVNVLSDLTSASASRIFNFAVFDEDGARLLRSLCQLRQRFSPISNVVMRGVGAGLTIGGRNVVDPLWDPTPDFSRVRLTQLRGALARMAHVAPALDKQLANLMAKGGYGLELPQLLDKSNEGKQKR